MEEPDFQTIPTEVLLMALKDFTLELVIEFKLNKVELYESILDELFERCPAEPLEDRPWYLSDFEFNYFVYDLW